MRLFSHRFLLYMNAEERFLIFEAKGVHQIQQDLVLQGPRTIWELELGIPLVFDN